MEKSLKKKKKKKKKSTHTSLFSLLHFSTRNRTGKKNQKTHKTGGNAGSIWQNACKKIALQDNVFVNNTVSIRIVFPFPFFFLKEEKIDESGAEKFLKKQK